jgi:hypothetical protein
MIKKLLLASVFAGFFAVPAHAATIFSDNFNANPSPDQYNGIPTGWSLEFGVVDIIGYAAAYDWYPTNGAYIDLDGSNGAEGQLSALLTNSLFNLAAGTYTLSFDYGINHFDGSDTDQIFAGVYSTVPGISFITSVDADALNHSLSTFTSYSISFVLASAVTGAQFFIAGYSVGAVDQSGGIIDNFEISQVPLPGAALLLLSGLAGIAGFGRKRRDA